MVLWGLFPDTDGGRVLEKFVENKYSESGAWISCFLFLCNKITQLHHSTSHLKHCQACELALACGVHGEFGSS